MGVMAHRTGIVWQTCLIKSSERQAAVMRTEYLRSMCSLSYCHDRLLAAPSVFFTISSHFSDEWRSSHVCFTKQVHKSTRFDSFPYYWHFLRLLLPIWFVFVFFIFCGFWGRRTCAPPDPPIHVGGEGLLPSHTLHIFCRSPVVSYFLSAPCVPIYFLFSRNPNTKPIDREGRGRQKMWCGLGGGGGESLPHVNGGVLGGRGVGSPRTSSFCFGMRFDRWTSIPLSVLFDAQNTPGTHQSSYQGHSICLMALIG